MSQPQRLKVLIVASWYPRPGSPQHGIFIQQQAEALATVCDVAVLHVLQGERLVQPHVSQEGDITVVRIGLELPKEPKTRIQHLRMLKGITYDYTRACLRASDTLFSTWGRPDIVHGHASMPGALGSRAISLRLRIPYVITEHQAEFLLDSPGFSDRGGRLMPALVKRAMRGASAMIAVSSRLARDIAAGGYHSDPTVIPNIVPGVEIGSVPFSGSATDVPRILHVSLLRAYEKNIPMLLQALQAVDRSGVDYAFTFVGDGPDRGQLEALAESLGLLGRRVEFIGARNSQEVRSLFSTSSFSVVSSRYETFCMVAAESLAAGRPLVCTRCGGPEDFVDDTVGLLVENDNSSAMAEAIGWMIERYRDYDPAKLHQHAFDRFSPQVVVPRIVNLYRSVLESASARTSDSDPTCGGE